MIHVEHVPGNKETINSINMSNSTISQLPYVSNLLNTIPDLIIIINQLRQIVYANETFVSAFGASEQNEVLGMRLGEVVKCEHSDQPPSGCGTSEKCSVCGALNAMLKSLEGKPWKDECRILTKENDALDLMVNASPFKVGEETYSICTLTDISNEKRRKVLERIFFHDILNTAGGLKGFLELLREGDKEEFDEYLSISEELSEKLIEEIIAQRQISMAENNELTIHPSPFTTREIMGEVKLLYENHNVAVEKKIVIEKETDDLVIITDKTVLRRVLGNLIKNALEASPKGATVYISSAEVDDMIVFAVKNGGVIPKEIQFELFKRSFSTKGTGRGIGTYSIKLLTEKYLKGEVCFESDEKVGTVFRVTYPKKIK